MEKKQIPKRLYESTKLYGLTFRKVINLILKEYSIAHNQTQIRYTPQAMLIRSRSLLGISETFIRFLCKLFRLWRGSWCQCIAFS